MAEAHEVLLTLTFVKTAVLAVVTSWLVVATPEKVFVPMLMVTLPSCENFTPSVE